ncbi:hypothetical protein GCM10025768_00230 [Microbacterium pseudoresistens]|uniref:ChbG/HpnK family deacetylase n=1 Tax=Microbacterium pseudoresistens TaxID=640634 RepID=A0A7Y9JNM5_9MICO|nr:ChbG/HpnK family deacetylase [Microbacterium pseudoresistens]NYD53859.1 hypothetical protein [Microbacterium pseudoresistens]
MTRRLVITADDLGRDSATNEAILGLFADGCVTAATLLAVAPAADDAVHALRGMDAVPHAHLALTRDVGTGWAPLSGAPADDDGLLPADPAALAGVSIDTVIAELDAQHAWFVERGAHPVVADAHAGALYGLDGRPWLEHVLPWCAQHALAFRLPRDPTSYIGEPLPAALAVAHERAITAADRLGVPLPDSILTNRGTAAEWGSYDAFLDAMIGQLTLVPEGTSEFFVHPSAEDAVPGDAGIMRSWEARLLRDAQWREALEEEGIVKATTWTDREDG